MFGLGLTSVPEFSLPVGLAAVLLASADEMALHLSVCISGLHSITCFASASFTTTSVQRISKPPHASYLWLHIQPVCVACSVHPVVIGLRYEVMQSTGLVVIACFRVKVDSERRSTGDTMCRRLC